MFNEMHSYKCTLHSLMLTGLWLLVISSAPALAHPLAAGPEYGAVDGLAIDYNNDPNYNQKAHSFELAVSQWNSMGVVEIRPDVWNRGQDLRVVSGYYYDMPDYYAWYSSSSGSDDIKFNLYTMQNIPAEYCGYPCADRLAMEELGHALGIGHNGIDGEPVCGTLDCGSNVIPPEGHDYGDYRGKYGSPVPCLIAAASVGPLASSHVFNPPRPC